MARRVEVVAAADALNESWIQLLSGKATDCASWRRGRLRVCCWCWWWCGWMLGLVVVVVVLVLRGHGVQVISKQSFNANANIEHGKGKTVASRARRIALRCIESNRKWQVWN